MEIGRTKGGHTGVGRGRKPTHRPRHQDTGSMHLCRDSNLLASESTEGGRANAGDTNSEAGHGAMEQQ